MDERVIQGTAPVIDLTGKRVLITGGSRGVGRACAMLFARAGASVGIAYRSRQTEADATVLAVEALGATGWSEAGDLSRDEGASALRDRVESEFETIDFLVVNHGVWPPEDVPIEAMTSERWRQTLSVNLDSVFLTLRALVPLVTDGGAIVLVTSTAGQRGESFHADYAATKGAMISMVKGLSGELAGRGVRINSVAPGWIDTEMSQGAFEGEGRKRVEDTIPLGRIASADDIAGPILFLCTELSRHITGEILNVNGGAVLVG